MTDRELLELAAKAAEIAGEFRTERMCLDGDWEDVTAIFPFDPLEGWWSPLADDGDALRLAAKLKLDVTWTSDGRVIVRANRWDRHGVPYGSVISRATEGTEMLRRAIVEAAAQIGRACTSGEAS